MLQLFKPKDPASAILVAAEIVEQLPFEVCVEIDRRMCGVYASVELLFQQGWNKDLCQLRGEVADAADSAKVVLSFYTSGMQGKSQELSISRHLLQEAMLGDGLPSGL